MRDGADGGVVRGIAGVITANVSLVVAILVYMGWAYEQSLFGYFHVNPVDLGAGIPEYLLRSLTLFNPGIVIVAVAFIAVLATSGQVVSAARAYGPRVRAATAPITRVLLPWLRTAGRPLKKIVSRVPAITRAGHYTARVLSQSLRSRRARVRSTRVAQVVTGVVLTGAALILAAVAGYIRVSTYLLLALLATGPLLLTRPHRQDRRGRLPYVLANVVAAVAALWAGSLYASSQGTEAAQNLVANLQSRTAVAVYSTQDLAIRDPGVPVQRLPSGYLYRYRYLDLRLLTMRSGTYYLLPDDWTQQLGVTYILDASDQIRVELYSTG
jgi:hypothetical protein